MFISYFTCAGALCHVSSKPELRWKEQPLFRQCLSCHREKKNKNLSQLCTCSEGRMVFGSSLLIVYWPNKSHRHYSTLGLGVHVPFRRSLQVTCWCAGSGILQQCRVQDRVNKNSQPHVLLMATVINVQQELKMCKTLFQESYANYLIDLFQ